MKQPVPLAASGDVAADLAELVEELTARLKAGESVDLDQLVSEHPALADELRRLLPAMQVLAALSGSPEGSPRTATDAGLSSVEPLGDFQLIRELGRGGMGIVYEAEQRSLGRRVALKVLPYAATMDAKQLQRFRNEAKAAASLHHEHIVPVYAVGCERGVHYYAMQFIEGQSLAEVLRGLRHESGPRPGQGAATPPVAALSTERDGPRGREFYRYAAELIAQAAGALEHAHSVGIVHRDVKPGNLLLDSFGKLWVADFGLARVGPDAGLTASGDVLGTLRYMAPEQALAKHGLVDHRADVYGLGATLYELLTLRPAVGGETKQEILERIAFADPPPPRRLERTVPAELETIALKALAKDPAERYACAGELADDLQRFLADRPITARRPTARQRLARWARQHRPEVLTAAAALALLLGAALAGLVMYNALVTHQRDQTRAKEREARRLLYDALIAQAQAGRWGGQLGARAAGLAALEQASRLAADLGLDPQERLRLRNEAVALMALPDLRVVREWDGFPPGSRQLAFDSDLDRYARCDDRNAISVRRVEDDHELFRLSPADGVNALKFSPCGRYLAARAEVVVWDLVRRAIVLTVPGGFDVAFRPDGAAVAVSHGDGTVRIHDLPGGVEAGRFTPADLGGRQLMLAFSDAGTLLAVHNYGGAGLQIWDPATRMLVHPIQAPGGVMAVAWHPDGRRFAVGCSGQRGLIYVHDLDTGRWSGAWTGHQSACVRLAFHPAGDLVVSEGWDDTTRLWDPREGRQLFCLPGRSAASFGRDGRLAVRHGRRVALIEPGDRATYRRLFFPGLRIAAVALHPDGRHLVAAGSGLAGWDLVAGRELPVVSEPEIASVFFDPAGGHLVTAGAAGIQRRSLGDAGTPPSQVRFGAPELLQPPGRSAFEAVLSGDGQTLVVVDNRSRAVAVTWGTRELRPWLTGPINMKYPAVSPDGRWAATGSQYGNEVRVWDTRTGGTVHHIPHATGAATRVAFSADGRWLFVGVLGEYRLLEVGSWREHWRAPADSAGDVHAPGGLMAVAPDSAVAAVRHSRSVIRLLDVASGRELADLTAPDLGLLSSLSFGPGGRLLAAATEDGTVHLWDLHLVRERLAALGLDWGPPDGAGH